MIIDIVLFNRIHVHVYMHQIIKSVFLQLFELIFHRQTIAQIFNTHHLVAYSFGFSFILKKKNYQYMALVIKKKSLLRKINFFSHLILSFFVFFDRFDGPQEYHYMKFLQHAIQKSAPFMPDAFFRNV